jgi:uncharacterized protein YijF (DUF1287 family)
MKILYSLGLLLLISVWTQESNFERKLSDAAILITKDKAVYNGAYVSIPYPKGDVPSTQGVCTDVIIRAYRKLGIDLQKEVHEDMKRIFQNIQKLGD